jgi:tetratricopeptide (TPR) repeat protein
MVLSAVLALGAPAFAQEEGAAEPDAEAQPEDLEAAREARRHFSAGLEHFQGHRYREAIRSFQLAAQLVPSADLWYNIARAHEELSEHEAAIEHYQRYLRDRVDPPDRARVEAHIEELRERAAAAAERRQQPSTGVLRLSANREGAEVRLDGEEVGTTPVDGPRELEPGRHRLALLRTGYVPFRSEVSVEAGVTTAAYADLVPETRYRAIRNDPVFAWIAWGLGVAALGASVGLGVHAASLSSNDLDSALTWAAWSDGALAGAIGLGVVGLVLWFVEGRTVGTERVTVDEEDARDVRGPGSLAP